jgi:hypothetical protein
MVGCSSKEVIHVFSPNGEQKLTVIRNGSSQYVINGKVNYVPDTNYVKMNISKRDLATGLYICWDKASDYNWDVVTRGEIIENKLDYTKYSFSNTLPTDSFGIPTQKKFINDNCACILLDYPKTSPPSETRVLKR